MENTESDADKPKCSPFLIEELYNDTECSVSINGNMTKWFKLEGVGQGCVL